MRKNNDLPQSDASFGHEMLQYFAIDPSYKLVNSGAYGATPNYALEAKKVYYHEIEKIPDLFMRVTHEKLILERKDLLGKYLNCSGSDLAIVENGTEGINSALKSLTYKSGDVILLFDTVFKMVEEVCRFLAEKFDINVVIIKTSKEILNSKEKLIGLAEEYITKYAGQVKLAVIDHIASFPSVIFPVKELVSLFRQNNILCIVDGAHVPGQIDLDIQDLNPDIYVGNLHKWLFCAKSASILYVKKELQSTIFPIVISHFYKTSFHDDFKFLGTRDYSSAYSCKEGVEFIERLGDERIKKYNHQLVVRAGKEIAKIWGTEELITQDDMIPAMVNVLMPYQESDIESKLGEEFCEKYNTYVKLGKYEGKYYARFSSQIFNEIDDYVYVANAVKEALNI